MTEEEKKALELAEQQQAEGTTPEGEPKVEEQAPTPEETRSIVNELKALRAEKREALEAKEEAERLLKAEADKNKDDVTLKVEAILEQKAQERAIDNKKAAMNQFISERKEFHEDNDQAGLKMLALKNKFAMFNTTGMTEIGQFYSAIKDAYTLLGGKDSVQESKPVNPFTSQSEGSSGDVKVTNTDRDLSPAEKKIIDSGRYSKEKLLEMKKKQPDFVESLLKYVDA